MSTFTPNGNKPIKLEAAVDPKQESTPVIPKIPSGLNSFPGRKRSENDEFIVDL